MAKLTWTLSTVDDPGADATTSQTKHGTYSIAWLGSSAWVATFQRAGAALSRRQVKRDALFETIGGAVEACQTHADQYRAGRSNRVAIV
jgi:hypothetical protein